MRFDLRAMTAATMFFASSASFAAPLAHQSGVPHYDLEMTSEEYRALVQELTTIEDDSSPELRRLLDIGARNLEWYSHINSLRDPSRRLELSTPGTQGGIPIDTPSLSNEAIIMQQYNDWLAATDVGVSHVLLNAVAFPDNPPVSDDAYLQAARQIDKIYQRASRWLLQLPYRDAYKAQQKYDVRGYYFLSREADLQAKLQGWNALSDADKARLQPLLVGQCFNAEANTLEQCSNDFAAAVLAGTVAAYFDLYAAGAKDLWDSYFAIPVQRTDVTWTARNANSFRIPFRDPENTEVTNWLRDNIEDEFKWNGWQLRLDFIDSSDDYTTHIVFEPGTTPHVNELGGSIITMDANRSLNEYSSRWTIRHEYGHVLGLPDCYVEFFDEGLQAMVNYQLDIDNLMCSRRGKFQQGHYDELRRVYFTH